MNEYDRIIAAYSDAATELAPHYDGLSSAGLFEDVRALLPDSGLALDIGAGSGRDAAWLSALGFEVVAVEPASSLRAEATRLHDGARVRWLDDRLPTLELVHRLGLSYDLVLLSAVWQHIVPDHRPRALRKIATLMRPGAVLVMTLRNGPAPPDRPMYPTSVGEVEGLARALGLEVLRVAPREDSQARPGVSWKTICLRMPDDGTGALPLIRGIVLADDKSSTYKLALLRAVGRIADAAPAAAVAAPGAEDAVEVPLGLVALNWLRMYLPLIRAGLPQAPRNVGPDGLGFAKTGFRALLDLGLAPVELRVGSVFFGDPALAVRKAIGEAAATIVTMPVNFTRLPNSSAQVFEAIRAPAPRAREILQLDLETLAAWGSLRVPGHLWRALTRFGSWIEPMLAAEWARLSRRYADNMQIGISPGVAEAALAWKEPARTTATARLAAERLIAAGEPIHCVWSGKKLEPATLDVDHCMPWSAMPCEDLWNLAPANRRLNQHEKRDRLPSGATFAQAKDRFIHWWEAAYLDDPALRARFATEASLALPLCEPADLDSVFTAMDWRRLRLSRDQQVPEWTVRSG